MSWWWILVPLWPLSGLVGGAWFYYALTKTYSLARRPYKAGQQLFDVFAGPCSIIGTLMIIRAFPSENRWGLRFR